MPNWSGIWNEVRESGHTTDVIRRKYLRALFALRKRNIITYYSGWLQKQQLPGAQILDFGINDKDKGGFMSVIHKMDRTKGLDLILHTPGGDLAAVESIIDYLRQMFGTNITAIIPQIAMSGGTLMACACKEIIMGLQSNIGPFDPQFMGLPAQAIKEDFERAGREIAADQTKGFVWQPILQRLSPGVVTQIDRVIDMADQLGNRILAECMFAGEADAVAKAQAIVNQLGSNAATAIHGRHLHRDKARTIGLKIVDLEADNKLQDAILSVHHANMITFEQAAAYKMIENQNGNAYISAQNMIVAMQ